MNIFKRKNDEVQTLDAAQGVVAEEQGNVEHSDDDTQIALLERHLDEDPAAQALIELDKFDLTPGARSLLDRALDNLAKNKGANLPDPDARLLASMRSDLIEASGNDLSIAIEVLVDSCAKPQDAMGAVYSLCYQTVKAAAFICNLDYRRYLDPRGDFDMLPYLGVMKSRGEDGNDPRAEGFERSVGEDESPLEGTTGHETRVEWQFEQLKQLYGGVIEDESDAFCAALDDLRLFLQLTCESFGWDPNEVLPFANVMEADGSFTRISDAQVALDHYEIKRKEAQVRRREQEGARLMAAAEKARAIVAAKLARR